MTEHTLFLVLLSMPYHRGGRRRCLPSAARGARPPLLLAPAFDLA
jgi:hypothetical protein